MQHIFGPVASRRLGYSLGVEVVTPKTCSFNCIYCQAGRTTDCTLDRKEYVPTDEIIAELEQTLPRDGLHYVTFSGSGEPTLHAKLGRIITRIKELCDTPVCVITNSSLIWRKDVRNDIRLADVVVPSLDSAVESTFRRINHPASGINVEKIIGGLVKFRKVFSGELRLEIMFLKGINDSPEEVARLKEAVELIEPDSIDLNTVVRPPWKEEAVALSDQELRTIAGFFGPKTNVLTRFNKSAEGTSEINLQEEVYQLVRRRGVTMDDLVTGMGLHRDVAQNILNRLVEEGKIKKISFGGATYYREHY